MDVKLSTNNKTKETFTESIGNLCEIVLKNEYVKINDAE